MSATPQLNTGNLESAIKHAMHLLSLGQSGLAREKAEAILRTYPNEVNCLLVVAAAMREQGDNETALKRLQALLKRAPDFALAQQELGFAYAEAGRLTDAITALKRVVAIEPKMPASWKLMGELFLVNGDEKSSAEAINQSLMVSAVEPDVIRTAELFKAGKIAQAERLCRRFLMQNPSNVNAIRLLADIGIKIGMLDDAEKLLVRCLELAPEFHVARLNYAHLLSKKEKLAQALTQVDHLLKAQPKKEYTYILLRASILVKIGDFEQAKQSYEYLLSHFEPRSGIALSYAHTLKTIGLQQKAIDAYRHTIDLKPSFGDAYWSLANLKTFRFEDSDLDAMRREIEKPDCTREDHFHLCFALGKALEDRDQFDESFHYYQRGNDIKEKLEQYNADLTADGARRIQEVCTRDFMSASSAKGCQATDPIFIVGLPRTGSTLLEQILASHSLVDGTKELVDILAMVRRLGGKKMKTDNSLYPELLPDLSAAQLDELGREYIDRTRIQRADAPLFIDKMPNNFFHIGFISLILPNAKIIDARRHPMAACFSCFKQLFAKGQHFTYGLSNIGHYYRTYIDMMDHWERVLPDKVLRVQYEEMVADTENQVRRMLDHCGLEFEEGCLQFYKTERAVRTASSEQVRQPIYSAAMEHWRNFEPHLDELKAALGPVLDRYPIASR
jgi:tetratricopeptide (TPR) repeat protein